MNKEVFKVGAAKSFVAFLINYYLDGPQQAPIVKVVRCPECNEPFLVKAKPLLNSHALTIALLYGAVYDLIDGHLHEKHGQCLTIARSRFIRSRAASSLTRKYGRVNA